MRGLQMPTSMAGRVAILVILILSAAISWWFFTEADTRLMRILWAGSAAVSGFEALKLAFLWLVDEIRARARARADAGPGKTDT